MTIQQVIDAVDLYKPNAFDYETKTSWINRCEGYVQTEVMLRAVEDCVQYRYEQTQTANGCYFPDDHTMVIAEPFLGNVGADVFLSDLSDYSSNNTSGLTIKVLDRSSDGLTLTFADGTFAATGTTPETGTGVVGIDGSQQELLVAFPHSKIYEDFLAAMIDYANGEYNRYNNDMALYNADMGEYMRWFARNYEPADWM